VKLTITSSTGEVVRTLTASDVKAGSHSLEWDGKDSKGNRVAAGTYTVTASGVSTSGSTLTPSMTLVGTVSKVLYKNGSAYLVVDGVEVALSDVSGIGEVGTFSGNN
jgi:flagellar basal-body rod modification protein FlgD